MVKSDAEDTSIKLEEIALKLKKLLDELSLLDVHSIVIASFTNKDKSVTFGMEMNTSQKIAASLLKAASKRVEDMHPVREPN